jgi:thioredoxin-like negative regulator of GroEL
LKLFAKHVEKRTVPWLVNFGAAWCQPCHNFQPFFKMVLAGLKGLAGVKVGAELPFDPSLLWALNT